LGAAARAASARPTPCVAISERLRRGHGEHMARQKRPGPCILLNIAASAHPSATGAVGGMRRALKGVATHAPSPLIRTTGFALWARRPLGLLKLGALSPERGDSSRF